MTLPNPVFEGSEKRLEIDFAMPADAAVGLRALTRGQLDELMSLAHCTIVSSRSNEHFDAYVLSESSLFVYPTKWVLKTCGTTRLLSSVPRLLELAEALDLKPCRCKFTRASFLFPEQQHFPHTSWEDEVTFLDTYFDHLAEQVGPRQAYVLGEQFNGLQWHVYVAGRPMREPTFNVELCMTELGDEAARQFFRSNPTFVSSERTTIDTGIANLKKGAVIDDYVFEPCGYSMNGIDRTGFMTIHVTPEKGFSYASVELSGHKEDMVDLTTLLPAAINIFRPGKVSLALSVDNAAAEGNEWVHEMSVSELPAGYHFQGVSVQHMDCGGKVVYFQLAEESVVSAKAVASPGSPKTVFHTSASSSFLSCTASSDSEPEVDVVAA